MDPFKTAQATVNDLQDRHDRLVRAIPKLQEQEKQLNENVQTLGRQEMTVMTKLEKLQAEIGRRTTAFNTWQQQGLDELNAEKALLEGQKRDFAEEYETKTAELEAVRKSLTAKEMELATTEERLATELADAAGAKAANDKWAAQLIKREDGVNQKAEENTTLQDSLSAQQQELERREGVVAENEQTTSKALETAKTERNAAHTLLEGAKEKIAANDSRESEMDKREVLLDARERELNQLAIRLDDRRKVQDSNSA